MRCGVLITVMMSWLVGCSSGPNWYQPLNTGSSPTGNLGLEFDLANPQEQQYARYRVQPDGTVLFWGGRDAILDTVTWKGTLPAASAAELEQLVRSGAWFASPPRGDGVGDGVKGDEGRLEAAEDQEDDDQDDRQGQNEAPAELLGQRIRDLVAEVGHPENLGLHAVEAVQFSGQLPT